MLPLGTKAPEFTLPDTVSGKVCTLSDVANEKATVVMFICNHCPFVKHIFPQIVSLVGDYKEKGVSFVAISSNDIVQYPQDGPEKMKELFQSLGLTIPYLFDETQEVAKAYDAACTPDFYIFDSHLKCAYRGQLDDSRPDNGLPVTGADLRGALDAIIAGNAIEMSQKPSLGCNIKWKT